MRRLTRTHYKLLADHRAATIRDLRRQLSAERQLNTALSGLAFVAQDQQDPATLKKLRMAVTRRRKLVEGRAA